MILIRGKNKSKHALLKHLNSFSHGSVATIGNFDGLHRGHQALIEQLKARAKALNLPSVVITFEPLPREFFLKNKPESRPPRLTRFKEKWKFLKAQGIDVWVCLHFNAYFSQCTATEFVENLLLNTLHTRHLVIGEDFHFGRERKGNLTFLRQYHDQFTAEIAPVLTFQERRISSTWVREALQNNDLVLAEKLLGRPYSLLGKIIHGDKRAREWGVPTANLNVHRSILPTVLPVRGVYIVSVSGLRQVGVIDEASGLKHHATKNSSNIWGVANVGCRPTVNGFRNLLEVHLLNFNQSIYGETIEVHFIHKLRDEKRFESLDLLKQQILKDVEVAREFCLKECFVESQ